MAVRLATRGSALALAQSGRVAQRLSGAELVEVSSDGSAGDKARFVNGVESALLEGRADIGIHSAKDMPAGMTDGLVLAAVAEREERSDAWIGAGSSLADVEDGARVGTASLRRRAQLLAARPDLRVEELHGNVDTRLQRLVERDLDGIVLASAGLRRLGRQDEIAFLVSHEEMTPAAGQGSLVLQTREGDSEATALAESLNDTGAFAELSAERAVVTALDASCATPLGVSATLSGGDMAIEAFLGLPDGSEWIRDRIEGAIDPEELGRELADRLLGAGADALLASAEKMAS